MRCALNWLQSWTRPAWARARWRMPCCSCARRASRRTPPGDPHLPRSTRAAGRRDICSAWRAHRQRRGPGREAQALIVQCEPKPGRPFAVHAEGNGRARRHRAQKPARLKVFAQPRRHARLRINDLYAQAMRGGKAATAGHAGSALAAGGALVHEEHPAALRHHPAREQGHRRAPEELLHARRDRDEAAGAARDRRRAGNLHESTISRVTTAKYMATPRAPSS